MENAIKKAHAGFTLVELIVVIAIVAILSTIGFVSYNGYIASSRDTVRKSDLGEATGAITAFIASQQRAPRCKGGAAVCYFAKDTGIDAAKKLGTDANMPGIEDADWDKLNIKKTPEDPKKAYYVFANGAGDKFAVFATLEENNKASSYVTGSDDFSTSLGGITVNGFPVDANGAIQTGGAPVAIAKNGDTAAVPYKFP